VLTDIRALADHFLMALPNINSDTPKERQKLCGSGIDSTTDCHREPDE
jgi:hypothetical protein